MGTFHWRYGWNFERKDNGDVMVSNDSVSELFVIPASEWPSIVAAVSAQGSTADAYRTATELHDKAPNVGLGWVRTQFPEIF